MEPKITVTTYPALKHAPIKHRGNRYEFGPESSERCTMYLMDIEGPMEPGVYNFWIVGEATRIAIGSAMQIPSSMTKVLADTYGPHLDRFVVEIECIARPIPQGARVRIDSEKWDGSAGHEGEGEGRTLYEVWPGTLSTVALGPAGNRYSHVPYEAMIVVDTAAADPG
jgi:hypothetical protein